MMKLTFAALTLAVLGTLSAEAQVIIPGPNGPMVQPFYPSQGTFVTPSTISGFNPQTGGWNTANSQIAGSAFDPNREGSRFNGTRRWVHRPITNSNGQVVGYQEGYVWNNSFTNQEHGDLQNFTPNNMGGVGTTQQAYNFADGEWAQRQHTTKSTRPYPSSSRNSGYRPYRGYPR